jgi:hypothetical protein
MNNEELYNKVRLCRGTATLICENLFTVEGVSHYDAVFSGLIDQLVEIEREIEDRHFPGNVVLRENGNLPDDSNEFGSK